VLSGDGVLVKEDDIFEEALAGPLTHSSSKIYVSSGFSCSMLVDKFSGDVAGDEMACVLVVTFK